MTAAVRQRVTVGPGGTVQLRSDRLHPGDAAEVIALVEREDSSAPQPQRSLADYIGSVPSNFETVEEVDAYIRELRDEWD